MAALEFKETEQIVRFILGHSDRTKARSILYQYLIRINSNEGQFYEGIVKHAEGLKLAADDWFKLLSILQNKVLHSELPLSRILTEEQQDKLK